MNRGGWEPSLVGATQDAAWQVYCEQLRRGVRRPPFAEQWRRYNEIFAGRAQADGPPRAWRPRPEEAETANCAWLAGELGAASFAELHRLTVDHRERFWGLVLERLGVVFEAPPRRVLDLHGGPAHPLWLPGARLDITRSCFRGDRRRVAVVTGCEGSGELVRITLGELEDLVDAVSAGLAARGVGPGARVALYMPMTLECVAAYVGVIRAGAAVVSIADSFAASELARRLELGEATMVVTTAATVRSGRRIEPYARAVEAGAPPAVVVGADGQGTSLRPGDMSWPSLLRLGGRPPRLARAAEELTNVLFSSGTTGDPKLIPWTQLTPLKCAMDAHFHHDVRPGEVLAWPTNIGWMMGPWLIYASLLNGAAMALFEGHPGGRDFAVFCRAAEVTMLGVVPSLVRAWREQETVDDGALDRVRRFSSTGEPSSREDMLWLMSRSGYHAPVIEYCGGTEIGGGYVTGSMVQPASPAAFTTPALGLDLVLLDDDGRPVRDGEPGEVFLCPPSIGLSERLLNRDHDEAYHAGCPAGPKGETLRRHGDLMVRLPGGFYRAQGRADDTMNLGGVKVGCLDLERVAAEHPAVAECAAVAAQTGGEGAERLVLFVVPRPDADVVRLKAEVDRLLARGLNPLFKVGEVVLVERLPRTASNKLMRRELRSRLGGATEQQQG